MWTYIYYKLVLSEKSTVLSVNYYDLMPKFGKIVQLYFSKLYTIQGTEVGIFNFLKFLLIIFYGGGWFFRPAFCWVAIHSVRYGASHGYFRHESPHCLHESINIWKSNVAWWGKDFSHKKADLSRYPFLPDLPTIFFQHRRVSHIKPTTIIINHLLNRRETKQWHKYTPCSPFFL